MNGLFLGTLTGDSDPTRRVGTEPPLGGEELETNKCPQRIRGWALPISEMWRTGIGPRHVLLRKIKRALKQTRLRLRRLGADYRCLPDFLVIGAAKSGTSSLYKCMVQHPQIIWAQRKEVHFFDRNYAKGLRWYRAHFPFRCRLPRGTVTGEASPFYLCDPRAPERIASVVPHAKLIVLLRDPVDRAVSHYFHEVKRQREPLPLDKALEAEERRVLSGFTQMKTEPDFHSEGYQFFSYKRRGIYEDQLRRYFRYFKRGQLLILKSEDFFSQPEQILEEVFAFLGVDRFFRPRDLRPRNVGSYTREIPPAVYETLAGFFAPHNERLYQFLGRDLCWRKPQGILPEVEELPESAARQVFL